MFIHTIGQNLGPLKWKPSEDPKQLSLGLSLSTLLIWLLVRCFSPAPIMRCIRERRQAAAPSKCLQPTAECLVQDWSQCTLVKCVEWMESLEASSGKRNSKQRELWVQRHDSEHCSGKLQTAHDEWGWGGGGVAEVWGVWDQVGCKQQEMKQGKDSSGIPKGFLQCIMKLIMESWKWFKEWSDRIRFLFHRDNSGRVVMWGKVGSSRGKTEPQNFNSSFSESLEMSLGIYIKKMVPPADQVWDCISPWPKGKLQNVWLWSKVPGSPVHRIANGDASEIVFFSRKRGAHENKWQWLMPQAVFPDRHRTPAKSEFKINKTKLFGINMSQILNETY